MINLIINVLLKLFNVCGLIFQSRKERIRAEFINQHLRDNELNMSEKNATQNYHMSQYYSQDSIVAKYFQSWSVNSSKSEETSPDL